MENKYLFDVETAWSFPIMQYTVNTSYVEVRKASGIAFILLELIANSEYNDEKLVVTLKRFGVPYDIHYIFAGELANMISYEIIQMKLNRHFDVDLIDSYDISDFEITNLGKRLFEEGTIPTGNNNVKKLVVYYDLAKKDTKVKPDLKLFRLDNSTIDESCIGDIQLDDSDVERFINENMNRYAFRKGERISGFDHELSETFVYKVDDAVDIRIDQKKMYLTAKDKDRDEFIRKNYSLDTVSRIIAAKKKYSFPKNVHIVIDKYDYADVENVSQINMPSQYNNLLNVHNQLALSCSFDMKNSECTIAKDEAAEIIRKCGIAGFICYFDKGNLYSILPGMFSFDVEGFIGKCEVNMIVTQKLDEDKKQQVLREIFFKCISIDDSMSKCGVIKKLTEISGGKDYIEQFTLSEMKKQSNNEEKIASFLKLNEQFAKVNEWKEVSEERANSLLVELCKHITLEKFQVQNVLGEKLNKVLGLHELDYLSQISKRLVEKEGELIVYELLEGLNYSIDTILGAVNVFKTYCQKILDGETITGNSKLSGQCALLGQTLSELRGLTGIENALEDVTELDMDNDRFLQVMATFTDSLKKLDKYKIYAVEQFKQLDALMERYIEIKEVVTIEKEAIKNPKNISKNYIEQQLKKSRYRDAICDLHIRLQYELNRLFGTDNTPTYELLSDPVITQYLTEEELHDMHSLRICRNGFQHPKEKRDVKYS